MDRIVLLMLARVLTGFALLKAPLSGTFSADLGPITNLIGIITIVIFYLVLIYKGLMSLLGK